MIDEPFPLTWVPDIHSHHVLQMRDLKKLATGDSVELDQKRTLSVDGKCRLMLTLAVNGELEDPRGVTEARLRTLRVAIWDHFNDRSPHTFNLLMEAYGLVFPE